MPSYRGVSPINEPERYVSPNQEPALHARILSAVGRLRMVTVDILTALFAGTRWGIGRKAMWKHLERLREREMLWGKPLSGFNVVERVRTTVEQKHQPPTDGGRSAMVYGISPYALEWLVDIDSMSTNFSVRDHRGRWAFTESTHHDLYVAAWAARIINALTHTPGVNAIFLDIEFFLDEAAAAAAAERQSKARSSKSKPKLRSQRMDALLYARMNPHGIPSDDDDPDEREIPWHLGIPPAPGEVEFRWALEYDNDTEDRVVLRDKFITYSQLHQGTYQQRIGGDVLLTLVVPTLKRAQRLAYDFHLAWPDGWGVVSTWTASGIFASPMGRYLDLRTLREVPLLSIPERDENHRIIGYHCYDVANGSLRRQHIPV